VILLVRPRPHPDSVGLQSFMICEPLELEYLSTALEATGEQVEIADMILEERSLEQLLAELRPTWVGFTSYITHVDVVKEYARRVKAAMPHCVTAVGGVHAEVVPTDFLDPALDLIFHAHGLSGFVECVQRWATHPGADPCEFLAELRRTVAGLWDGPAKLYPEAPELPGCLPDRSKTARYRSRYDYIFHSRCALLRTSLGCAFGCDFCFCTEVARHRLLERPLSEVVAEIQGIAEQNIFIVDDNFLFRPERVLEFCRLLDEAGVRKHFLVFGRADFVATQESVLRRFQASGLQAVFMGLESFRQEELQDMRKRIDVETNVQAVELLGRLGLECHCGIIVSPDWVPQDFDHLARWLISLGRPFVNIQPLTPMPGTPLYARLEHACVIPREKHAQWDMTHLVLPPTRMSPRRFQWQILRTYSRTTTSLANHLHILRRYGASVYWRTLRGSLHLTGQYLKMIWRG
jgi:radical SAM superfamily enzyme YgiQ (UPF0313 family)